MKNKSKDINKSIRRVCVSVSHGDTPFYFFNKHGAIPCLDLYTIMSNVL